MRKFSAVILSVCFFLQGCQAPAPDTAESHYEKVSRQIEQLKADSHAAALTASNIKIVVNMLTTDLKNYSAVDSLWRYANRNVIVAKRPEVFTRSGLKVGLAADEFKAQFDITKRQLTSSEQTELFIVVSDGSPGYINIGREISVPRFYYFGRWYTTVDYQFRQAGKSLQVIARRLPTGLIEMELTPVFSKFLSTGGDLELTELSTRVTARPGQTVVLGATTTGADNVASALFTHATDTAKKQTLITVTPYSP